MQSAFDGYCRRHNGCTAIPPHNGYYVLGNAVYDAAGRPHVFHGIARPSLEWTPQGDHLSAGDYQQIAAWGANVVLMPLNQDFWLANAALWSPGYRATVDQNVAWARDAGLDVILDLHRSDRGSLSTSNPDRQPMPDINSVEFWKEVGSLYKGDPGVLFEIYSEPHDVSWDVWLSGGDAGYSAVGMQELYETVRSTGADNVIIISGLDWAFDLSGVPAHSVQGYNLIYSTHPLDYPERQPLTWDAAFGFLATTDPVIATAFGSFDCSTGFSEAFLQYAAAHHLSWSAWAWYPGGCTFPSLITDWTGAATGQGLVVRAHLP